MKKMNVGYLRVSTENQTEKYGLDLQKNKIIERAEKEGDKIDKWYIDGGYSGSTLDRPDIQRLLEDSKNGYIEKVYIYKLDRVSRDTIDTLVILYRTLPEYNVKIVSATEELSLDTPMDKMKIGIDALMGQYEREIISMRTKAGMLERVKSGLWMGEGVSRSAIAMTEMTGYYIQKKTKQKRFGLCIGCIMMGIRARRYRIC